ncbi:MAG TPA: hypothetical protein VKX17_01185 [Planctomycetota bacterium]|nr:hypothetical protein [Planctomycetota bacterium]
MRTNLISPALLLIAAMLHAEDAPKPSKVVATPAAELQIYIGKSLAKFLDEEHIALGAAKQEDEPPGVLHTLTFATPKETQRLVITLRRDGAPFSENLNWREEEIRKAVIAKIATEEKRK